RLCRGSRCGCRSAGGRPRHGCSGWRHAGAARLRGHVRYFHKLDIEDEVGLGGDPRVRGVWPWTSRRSVRQLPGNKQAAFAADLHAVEALVPAGNDAAKTLRKADWLWIVQLRLAEVERTTTKKSEE